ncbi:MAG: DUF523 domain-containing protein [Desulfuromonadales bacterium]
MTAPIRIGVSACLLGEQVRYDGGHKCDRAIVDILGAHFDFVLVCPEVECGMPTPREAMHLEGTPSNPRLITNKSHADKTDQMLNYCRARVRMLENFNLCGFIFKERSPSCGLDTVPLHGCGTDKRFTGGLFATEIARSFPSMPLEEAERLNAPVIRENFIEMVLRYQRLSCR